MTQATAVPEAATPGAASIKERLRNLAARPVGALVSSEIDAYMAVYAGRDTTRGTRLRIWQALIGGFTLEEVDSDVMHAARAELAGQPALNFKGVDHEGRKIFKKKAKQTGRDPATVNRYMVAISAVFTWSIEARRTPRGWVNPCHGIKRLPERAGRVKCLEPDQRDALLDACRHSRYPRLHALVLMALLTGARRGELMSLRWRDVDLANGVARLDRTKNGDRRALVLLPQLVETLKPFESPDGDRYVFGSVRSRYQQPADIQTAWRLAMVRASLKDWRFHDLRHCTASYMAQKGKSINVIAEVLGHRRLDMAMRYAHLSTQSQKTAMEDALGGIK
jgi:integrase